MSRYTPVTYTEWVTIISSIVTANLVITDQFGNPIQPNFRVGGVFYTLEQILALSFDAIENRMAILDDAHRIDSAMGDDLDEFGLLMSKKRAGNTQARVPIKYVRLSGTGPAVTIPTNITLLARDNTGTNTIQIVTAQDPMQPTGVSTILPLNEGSVWGWGTLVVAGAAGNIAAGTIAAISGTAIAGIDTVGNPPILDASVPEPTVAVTGTAGTQHISYALVVHGVTGTTGTALKVGGLIIAPNTLNGTNYVVVSWPSVLDAVSYDVLKSTDGGVTWRLLANTNTTSVNDQGQTTSVYALPVANTTNQGVDGADKEDDSPYRARIPLAVSETAASNANALIAAVEALDGVALAYVHDAVVGGTPAPGTATMQVLAVTSPIATGTGTLGAAIDAAIAATKAAGIVVSWSEMLRHVLTITYTLTVIAGTATQIGAALEDVNNAILAYFATLRPGDDARFSQIIKAMLNALEANAAVQSAGADAAVTAFSATDGSTTWTMQDIVPSGPTQLLGTDSAHLGATVVGG